MGYMRHHAIVVSAAYGNHLRRARLRAGKIFPWVSPVCPEHVNGVQSFFIPPDGSKEGWQESDDGDARRAEFIAWLRSERYEDGSSYLKWVEVQYGDDEGHSAVINHDDDGKP